MDRNTRTVPMPVVEAAIKFLFAMWLPEISPPQVTGYGEKGIQLEWHQGNIDLEIEIVEGLDAFVYYEDLLSGEVREYRIHGPGCSAKELIPMSADRLRRPTA